MNTSTCSRCQTVTPSNALSMSLDGSGMVCSSCAIAQKAVQEKAGMRKAYLSGAVIVGLALLYVLARILARI